MINAVICQVQIIVTDNTAVAADTAYLNQILKTSYRMYWLEDKE